MENKSGFVFKVTDYENGSSTIEVKVIPEDCIHIAKSYFGFIPHQPNYLDYYFELNEFILTIAPVRYHTYTVEEVIQKFKDAILKKCKEVKEKETIISERTLN